MQSAAFVRRSRPATLRGSRLPWQSTVRRIGELGRLALTALVLAVGLGGVSALTAAAPATASAATGLARPVVVSSRVDSLSPGPGAKTAPRTDPAAPQQARLVPADARRPAPAPAGVAVVTDPVDRPAVDPAGGTVVRRGPPRH
ncbi:hypothetical protein [Micromonospora sp. ATCC 39149]|uniref:Uncharacterized protein n=1 Tax=Micromonospora carbonacea TaxID=47853 RepID=A0A7D6CD56_9ACTN|nr:hypothetical protein [Micromonospora sp. ATCC 39149]QLJ99063.1 hypothetical protein HZU44_02410 [Micromonospora carbonacea]